MKALYKVINTQNVYDLGVRLGDVVEAEKLNSDCFKAYPRQHLTEWTVDFVLFRLYQLEKIRKTSETFEETVARVCAEPTSPANDLPIPEVPPEEKEAFTAPSVPSTRTSHDAHYASMAMEPVTISEMMMENEAIPPKARYHAAKAVEYFTRAGRKEGQDWKKEFEKALNHGYRAIHGKWPWEVRDH